MPTDSPPEIRPGRYYAEGDLAAALRARLAARPETFGEIALTLDGTGTGAKPRTRAAALSAALNPANDSPRDLRIRDEIAASLGWSVSRGFVRVDLAETPPP